jgi:Na+/melibiose symporter-like transporter
VPNIKPDHKFQRMSQNRILRQVLLYLILAFILLVLLPTYTVIVAQYVFSDQTMTYYRALLLDSVPILVGVVLWLLRDNKEK